MSTATDVLRQLIAAQSSQFDREKLAVDTALAAIAQERTKISDCERRISIIDATLDNLNSALQAIEEAEAAEADNPEDIPAGDELNGRHPFGDAGDMAPVTERGTRRPAPAVAVRRLLEQNPHGLTIREVVDQLASEIDTKSPTPRRIVQNTVYQLRVGGTLEKFLDPTGAECVRLRA